jgi:NAD(P)H dehydrogenase (quinone)
MYLGYFAASRQGEFATVDQTLARLIGRPPLTLRDVVKATLQMEK